MALTRFTLRAKTLLLVATTTALLTLGLAMPLRRVYLAGFLDLEEAVAAKDVARIRSALGDELEALAMTTRDYAVWDDSWAFAAGAAGDFAQVNFVDATFDSHRLGAIALLDTSGRVLFAKGYDPVARTSHALPPELARPSAAPLVQPGPEGVHGFLRTAAGPWLVASHPIRKSTNEGPTHGAFLMGRPLDAAEVTRLSRRLQLDLKLVAPAATEATREAPEAIRPLDARTLRTDALFVDLENEPVFATRLEQHRDVYARGLVGARLLLVSVLVAGLLFGLATVLLLERFVLRRVARLRDDVRLVAARADHSLRVSTQGDDELGELATNVNGMLGALERLTATLESARRLLRDALGRYMSEEIAEAVLSRPEGTKLGGEGREVTILFSDLRGYSTISGPLPPEEVVGLLNEYFGAMSELIDREGGCIIEFLGDAILAVFGAPHDLEDHAAHAVRAALAMRERTAELNRAWDAAGRSAAWKSRGIDTLAARIGLHTGRVVAGNLGSRSRMKYAVVGDAVNMAARIEGLNNALGTDLLASDEVFRHLADTEKARAVFAGEHVVKGRERPIGVYRFRAADEVGERALAEK